MTTINIVVKGDSDKQFLAQILEDLTQSYAIQFFTANARNEAHTLARTLQVRKHDPVALVLDAETTNPDRILEEKSTFDLYLRLTSEGIPFKVVLFAPEIEGIFVSDKNVFEFLTGKKMEPNEERLSKAAPKVYLSTVQPDWKKRALRLGEPELQALREVEPIKQLRTFITTESSNA